MKTFYVTYPIAGSVTVYVEAEDEQSAIDAGWEEVGDGENDLTWEAMEHIVRGNVFYGPLNEITVEEEDQ